VGRRFTRLIVLEYSGRSKNGHTRWLCRCDCGNTVDVDRSHLVGGKIQSCKCLNKERIRAAQFKHGLTKRGVKWPSGYSSWSNMLQRCYNKRNQDYKHYGGRGIVVCDRWKKFKNFYLDMGPKPKGLSIDRINNNGNYEPSNCRWATQKEQMNNTRRSTNANLLD